MTAHDRPLPAALPAATPRTPSSRPDPGGDPVASVADPGEKLLRLRDEIERIDRSLIALVAERVQLARRVGMAKRKAGLPTLDPAREAGVVRRAGALARDAGLEDEDVRSIFRHLIGVSRRAQREESLGAPESQSRRISR